MLDDAEAEADRDGWIAGDQFMRELDQWIVDLTVEVEREEAERLAACVQSFPVQSRYVWKVGSDASRKSCC